MSKKKEVAPKEKVKRGSVPKQDVLKVSKEIKTMAAFASLRGFNKRRLIQLLGSAEDNYRKNGRLVMS